MQNPRLPASVFSTNCVCKRSGVIAPLEWSVWLCEVVRTVRVLRCVPAAAIPSFGFLPSVSFCCPLFPHPSLASNLGSWLRVMEISSEQLHQSLINWTGLSESLGGAWRDP